MKVKLFVIGAISFIVGWNIFLIQRDSKLFESYNQPHPVCKQFTHHPDCPK